MKNILTGNEAIDALESIQASHTIDNCPRKCGYFISDDYEGTCHYDKGTVIAFDSTTGLYYENDFGNIDEAINWINQ